MREQVRDKGRLEHILESINNIYEFVDNMTFEQNICCVTEQSNYQVML